MASYFIYDSINQYRSDNDVNEGTVSGSSPTQTFAESDVITNHERSSDQNIGTTFTAINVGDTIQYALGSSATANVAAAYFTGASGDTAIITGKLFEDDNLPIPDETIDLEVQPASLRSLAVFHPRPNRHIKRTLQLSRLHSLPTARKRRHIRKT